MIKGEGKHFTLVRCKDDNDWLEQRKKGIGGSEVAAILGISKYKTPLALWLEKTGQVEPKDLSDVQAVEWGDRLEEVVGAKYAELHPERKVKRVNAVAQSITRPWAQASLDYEVKDGDRYGILEIKTAGLRVANDWKDGVPLYYLTQITHYMSVLNRDFADVAVLIGGQEYREYRIERDEDDIKTVNEAVDKFWHENVVDGKEPELMFEEGYDLIALFGNGNDNIVNVDPEKNDDIDTLIEEYRKTANSFKEFEKRKKELSQEIINLIGEQKGIKTSSNQAIWVRSVQSKYDMKLFEQENQELVEKYRKTLDKYSSTYVKNQGIRTKKLKKKEA